LGKKKDLGEGERLGVLGGHPADGGRGIFAKELETRRTGGRIKGAAREDE